MISIGLLYPIPYGGNSLETKIILENAPDFYLTITLEFSEPVNDLEISPNVLIYDSGESENSFKVISTGENSDVT